MSRQCGALGVTSSVHVASQICVGGYILRACSVADSHVRFNASITKGRARGGGRLCTATPPPAAAPVWPMHERGAYQQSCMSHARMGFVGRECPQSGRKAYHLAGPRVYLHVQV